MAEPSPLKILLLEDQALVRAGIKALLRMTEPSAEVLEASTYQRAVEILSEDEIDIAFLDFDLKSEQTGLDVLRFLRAGDKPTRAIMLSGSDEAGLVMACLDAGASGYIRKDLQADGLFRKAIDSILEGQVFLPSTVLGRGGYSPAPTAPVAVPSTDSLGLSKRQLEVLYFLCQGIADKVIAKHMNIAEGTVRKDYNPVIYRALGVSRRSQVQLEVARRGLKIPKPVVVT